MAGFDQFVVFAEMRTGSNFLETNINSFAGLKCYGEAFNPRFVGYPNAEDVLGVTQTMRDANPAVLLDAIKAQQGVLGGFRFFNDHDPRVLDILLQDPRCAKIVLTRNPIESYVSRKIAAATGQWKLTNARKQRTDTITFDAQEFEDHLQRLQDFQVHVLNALQRSGQTAFYVAYEDLQDVEVMNGLARFLGLSERIESLDKKLKKQNPEPLDEKVRNFDELEMALARIDRFNLSRTPNFEPRRGPAIPTYLAAAQSPLLYLPLRSGPDALIAGWLASLDGGEAPLESFSQKTLRQWKQQHPGHRSFTVLRHPLARAHAAFCDRILSLGPESFPELRDNLRRNFALPLAEGEDGSNWSDGEHRAAFWVFLTFLRANLGGQTNMRVDPAWASQLALLQGIAQFGLPDMILREDRLNKDLVALGAQVGHDSVPPIGEPTDPHAARLSRIVDDELQAMARDVYQRDYLSFGYADWTAGPEGQAA
jgi:hypothetical protein